jgi:hypothetical protein
MSTFVRRAGIAALLLLGALAGPNAAQAQFGQTRLNLNNPFIAQQQFLQNLQLARAAMLSGVAAPAFSQPVFANPYPFAPAIPPVFGSAMNPYVGGGFGVNPYSPALGGEFGSNPYSPAGSSGGSNPYSPGGWGGCGGGWGLPASVGPGYTLMGGADLLRATGTVTKDMETARIMRQQYYQAKLDTKRKAFDLEMYIKANTPTPTEEQMRITRQMLKRIQTNSNPAEIADGRSLNFLLNDIASKFHENKSPLSEIALDENVLKHLNVSKGPNDASLGLLRNGDKLLWPTALREIVPAEKRTEISAQAQALAQAAIAGKQADPEAIRDLRGQLDKMDDQLLKRANALDTPDYTAGQRFLADLRAAIRAISSGSAGAQVEFQKLVSKGEIHNLNDVVRVMVSRGWRFGPSLPTDEAAYRALHSALVSYNIALNQLVAQSEP